MISFVTRRVISFIPLLVIISVVSFTLIELPPGDFLTTYIHELEEQGTQLSELEIENLTAFYGLDKPVHTRYLKWISNILLRGNFGWSFRFGRPVSIVIRERLATTILLSLTTLLFTYLVAVPIGVLSAVRQYSLVDYLFTFIGFVGLALPNFLLALVLLWIAFKYFGIGITGLFSPEYVGAVWSIGKIIDLLKHIWVAVIVIGTAGMAGLIRVLRGMLLDELNKQYVVTARAKGLTEMRLLFKYPVRVSLNPIISGVGWLLPAIISGATITSIVLNLPTMGPILLTALMSQDMYLAGSVVMLLSVLVLLGNLISDILLAWIDPRIRFEALAR